MNKDSLPMIPFGKSKDITGQKFGKLTVLSRDANIFKATNRCGKTCIRWNYKNTRR